LHTLHNKTTLIAIDCAVEQTTAPQCAWPACVCLAVRPRRSGVQIRARRLVGTCRTSKCIFRE